MTEVHEAFAGILSRRDGLTKDKASTYNSLMLAPAPATRFFACLLALLSLPLAARAQDATPTPTPLPQQMALSSPFSLPTVPITIVAKRGKWFPVAVTLSNSGEPVSGVLRMKLVANGQFDTAPNESYCPVDLPTNSNKVIWMYGRLDRPDVRGVDISFSGRGFKAMDQQLAIQEPIDGQRVVLTVSDADSSLSDTLKSLRGKGLSLPLTGNQNNQNNLSGGGTQGPLRPLQTPHAGVPDRWFGMEGADMVVLGDFPHSALQNAQITALRGFVVGGGNLLALGGANAARLSSSPLADLWPGQISTSNTASPTEVSGLVEDYVDLPRNGADRLGGAPVVVTRTSLRPGAKLITGTTTNPLFSVRDNGAGRALFLGFDPSQPPFNGWSGQVALWRDVFDKSVELRRFDGVDNDSDNSAMGIQPGMNSSFNEAPSSSPTGILLSALSKAPQAQMPEVSKIAWFLSLYVFVLVPLNYAVLRYIDRRELAWITIPVIVAAFSCFAYFAALSIRGNAILTRQVDLVQTSLGSKTGRTDTLLWLFSPRQTSYNISSSSDDAAVADYANTAGGRQGAFSILQPADAKSFEVENANVWMWTDRGFVSQSQADLKNGITIKAGKVVNGTPFELRGVVWVQDHGVRSIGSIKPGASAAIPAKTSAQATGVDLAGAVATASHIDALFPSKTVANGIPNNALSVGLGANFGRDNEGALIVAWVKKAVVPLSIGMGDARSSDFSLVVVRVPNDAKSGQTAVAAREATVRHLVADVSPPNPNVKLISDDVYYCDLPPGQKWNLHVRGTKGHEMVQQGFSMRRLPGAPVIGHEIPMVFEAFNVHSRRWQPLSGQMTRDASKAAGWDFQASISNDFSRQPDRLLQLRVRTASVQPTISKVSVVSER